MPIQVTKRQSLYFRPHSNHASNKRLPLMGTLTFTEEDASLAPKLSAFDALPVELQIEIFLHCLSPFPTFSIDDAPLSIARVCRSWNHLVYNTPKLWSAFEVKIHTESTMVPIRISQSDLIKSTFSKVEQWLLRSKQCPLSIKATIKVSGRCGDQRFTPLLALLGSEAHRWRHIDFTVPPLNFLEMQHMLTENLPVLQSVVLRLTGYSTSFPSLEPTLPHIPWRQITIIDLQPEDPGLINLETCLDILSQAARLTECTFGLNCTMDLASIHQHHGTSILLPLLNKLTLNLFSGQAQDPQACLAQFLNMISVPQLRTLHLGGCGSGWRNPAWSDPWTAHHPEFLSFFRSTAKTLRSLTIAYFPFSDTDLLRCFSYLKNLTHLTLKYQVSDDYADPVTSSFLSSCTFPVAIFDVDAKDAKENTHTRATNPPLLPMLRNCGIAGHGRGYTSAALIAFIESRSKGSPRQDSDTHLAVMKSCRIFSTNVIDDEMEDYVRKWKDSGMKISLKSLVIR